MSARRTNNCLSASFFDENSQPDAILSVEPSVPTSPSTVANFSPQSLFTVSVPVADSLVFPIRLS